MKWLSNVCFLWGEKREREQTLKAWSSCLFEEEFVNFTFNNPTSSLNVFLLLRRLWLRCLQTRWEHMFGPYKVFRAQYPDGFRTFCLFGFKAVWKLFSTHIPRIRLSYISAFSYALIRHFQQRFSSSETGGTVNCLRVVYWNKVDL